MIADLAIVGAGIIGAACALEAARAGLHVTVIEPGVIGGGATAAGMGHIVVMDDSEAQFALTRLSSDLWNDLAPTLPASAEYLSCGTLWIAADEGELQTARDKHRFYAERGVISEILDSQQLREAEPNLRTNLAGGLLVKGDSVLYAPTVAAELLARSRAVLVRQRATAIEARKVTLANGDSIEARVIINAAGTDAPQLMPALKIPIVPRRGHLLITDRYPGFLRHQLVELGYLKSAHATTADSVAFNVQPRATGQLLIGSSRQFGTTSTAIDSRILGDMLARAAAYMPGLARLSAIRGWTGFRAATPDKLPLIGPCPDIPGAFLAAGHEGLGITTALATARLLVDQILDRASPIPREPYLPERYA